MIQYSKEIYRPSSERLPDDIVFYIAKFVGNQNNIIMRFINKHWYNVLKKRLSTRNNYTKDFISSVELSLIVLMNDVSLKSSRIDLYLEMVY